MSSGVGARMQSLQVRFASRAERLDITGLCVVRDANSETRRLRRSGSSTSIITSPIYRNASPGKFPSQRLTWHVLPSS